MISCEGLCFSYPGDSFALRIESFKIQKGENVALIGPSGCGKTTLLNLVAGIHVPAKGKIVIGNTSVGNLSDRERQAFRLKNVGLVPQNFELLDYLTVLENVLVPFRISGDGLVPAAAEERAKLLMERAGIENYADKFPSRISQGERQRVAMCRGLVAAPDVILADEPTGNLDPENQEKIVTLLLDEAARIGSTVVMITHEPALEQRFERVVDLMDLRKEVSE